MGLMWRRYNQAPIRIPRGITSLHLLMRMVVFLPINWMINCLLCFHFFPKLCYKVADLCFVNFVLQWKLYPLGLLLTSFQNLLDYSSLFGFREKTEINLLILALTGQKICGLLETNGRYITYGKTWIPSPLFLLQ